MFKYSLNTTSSGRLYFYVEEKWLNLMTINTCKEKLAMAQYTRKRSLKFHMYGERRGDMP